MDARPSIGMPHAPKIWIVPECSCNNSNSDTSVWTPVYTTTYGVKVPIPLHPPLILNDSLAIYPQLKTLTADCYATASNYLYSSCALGIAFYDEDENLITDDYGNTYAEFGSTGQQAAGSGGTPNMCTLSNELEYGYTYQMAEPKTVHYAALVLKSLRGTYAVTMSQIALVRY